MARTCVRIVVAFGFVRAAVCTKKDRGKIAQTKLYLPFLVEAPNTPKKRILLQHYVSHGGGSRILLRGGINVDSTRPSSQTKFGELNVSEGTKYKQQQLNTTTAARKVYVYRRAAGNARKTELVCCLFCCARAILSM